MAKKPTYEELEQRVKESEKEVKDLRSKEKRLKIMDDAVASSINAVGITDLQGKLIYVNNSCIKMWGYDNENEILGRPLPEFWEGDGIFNTIKELQEKGSASGEDIGKRKDGSSFTVRFSANIFKDESGNPTYMFGSFFDITEHKLAEETLRESEEKYRQLVNHAPAGICEFDLRNQKFISVNDIVSEYTGYTKEELFSMNPFDLLTEDSQKLSKERLGKLLSGEPIPETVEYKIKRKNGSELWVLWNVRFVYEEEKPIRATVVVYDITERKKAEQALQKSEEKYRLLVEEINDIIFRTDQNGIITFVSPVVKSVAGYDPSELIGQHFTEIVYHEDLEFLTDRFKELLSGVVKPSEYRIMNKSGEPVWVRSSSNLIYDGKNIVGVRGVLANISEEKDLGVQLQHTQKMESLGLMAGGIAHDLNNILSGIVSYPELLLMDLPEDSPLRKPIETIKESGIRAADVVSDLLTIARGVATGKDVSNLNTIIEEYMGSAEYQELKTIHPFITFKTDLDFDLLNISCSPTHIKKSLTNLITNAYEAIEGSGTVTISTIDRYLDEPLKGYEDVRKGEYAVLTVSDQGSGISADDFERIFEPFYTKKVMGRSGTGLGLAVVWNTVQDHNGYINVNTSDKGTGFELYFPVTREKVAAEREEVPLDDYLGHGEKILVVDDEERQREIAGGILTRLGYNSEAVSSGEDAIEYVKENPVDLILLDMVMPKGINGRKTYEEIIKIHPGQKAIIASGYAKTKEVDLAQELGAGKYIKKPYTLAKVGLAVKEELEK